MEKQYVVFSGNTRKFGTGYVYGRIFSPPVPTTILNELSHIFCFDYAEQFEEKVDVEAFKADIDVDDFSEKEMEAMAFQTFHDDALELSDYEVYTETTYIIAAISHDWENFTPLDKAIKDIQEIKMENLKSFLFSE